MHGKCRAGLSDHLIKLLIQLLPDIQYDGLPNTIQVLCKLIFSW